MTRAVIDRVLLRKDTRGDVFVADGRKMYVYDTGTTDEVTIYNAASGGSTVSQPLTADDDGQFPYWVGSEGSYDFYTPADGQTITRYLGSTPGYLTYSGTWNIPSTANGANATTQVTVAGAQKGDTVEAAHENLPNLWSITGIVTATDTVDVWVRNFSGSTADPASGLLKLIVKRWA